MKKLRKIASLFLVTALMVVMALPVGAFAEVKKGDSGKIEGTYTKGPYTYYANSAGQIYTVEDKDGNEIDPTAKNFQTLIDNCTDAEQKAALNDVKSNGDYFDSDDADDDDDEEGGDGSYKQGSTNQATQAIADITEQLKPHADINQGARTLKPIMKIVNLIIGILASAFCILIGLFTAIDILYLVVPALHNSLDEKAMAKGQTGKDGGVKPRLVSEDACQAYNEVMNEANGGKNLLLVYLKKRIGAYIAVGIVLYMLLSGNLSLLVNIVLKALNGVFGFAEDFAGDTLEDVAGG